MDSYLWKPSTQRASKAQIVAFQKSLGLEGQYTELHKWSIDDPGRFWSTFWDWCGIIGNRNNSPNLVTDNQLFDNKFFPESTLNFAENLLTNEESDTPAIMFQSEDGRKRELSWDDLRALVSRFQSALISSGIGPGDRVAVWLPNIPETYAIMLAASSIGAVFSSTSPDFGVDGVLDRFGQIEPKILFATDNYFYAGIRYDVTDKLTEVANQLTSVQQIVVISNSDDENLQESIPKKAITLKDFFDGNVVEELKFTALPFDHPLYILYSSGTTGKPKCIVHRAGGILLKHLSEHRLHCDIFPGDRIFYFTTAGWMMWNWLASALASRATLVLYDGSPFHPNQNRLFDLVEEFSITLLGVSAKFIDATRKSGLRPVETHTMGSLRTVCSTGSPLNNEGFEHVYTDWKADLHLASISGGTDLCGCLVGGNPTDAVYPGQIQVPALGMDIKVLNLAGESLKPGEPGELVCASPFPSMPIGFWKDDGDRYYDTYFQKFPGFWHQGDFASWTPEGGIIIHGRSDATLNPGGIRIGTAEIYRPVEQFEEIVECLAIGQTWKEDTRIILFVVMVKGFKLNDQLVNLIKTAIRTRTSPRHVPAAIIEVPELPRTRSGKLVELAVREAVENRPIQNLEALENPDTLEYFRNRPELSNET